MTWKLKRLEMRKNGENEWMSKWIKKDMGMEPYL